MSRKQNWLFSTQVPKRLIIASNLSSMGKDSVGQVYKESKTLKFTNLLYLQNCLFMPQIETNQKLANSFVD